MSCHENKSSRDLPDDLDYDHVTLRVIVTVLLFLICPSNAVVKIHNQGSTFYVCWSVLTTPYFHHVPVQCGFKNKRAFWHQKVSDLEDDLSSDDYMHVAMLLNRWHKNETVSLSFFFFFSKSEKTKGLQEHFKFPKQNHTINIQQSPCNRKHLPQATKKNSLKFIQTNK